MPTGIEADISVILMSLSTRWLDWSTTPCQKRTTTRHKIYDGPTCNLDSSVGHLSSCSTRPYQSPNRPPAVPDTLVKGPLAGEMSAMPSRSLPAMQYFGVFNVGTPAKQFTGCFDTGSSDVWLPLATCQSTSCLTHDTYNPNASSTSTVSTATLNHS